MPLAYARTSCTSTHNPPRRRRSRVDVAPLPEPQRECFLDRLSSLGVCLLHDRVGGKNMETLGDFGIFLAGVGILLIGSGLLWFVSVYSKK